MGLAASQARLLFITNRQNDVSAKMQRISNENLILARDAEDLDAKYKQMKNRETYKVGGVDLSYDLLMGSQAAQNGTLTLLQSRGGAVVLSPSMASNLGLSNPGSSEAFKTKWPDQTKFIAKMTGMDEANVRTILNEINKPGAPSIDPDTSGIPTTITVGAPDANGKYTNGTLLYYLQSKSTTSTTHKRPDWNTWCEQSGSPVSVDDKGGIKGLFYGGDFNNDENRPRCNVIEGSKSITELYQCAGSNNGMMYLGSARSQGQNNSTQPSTTTAFSNFEGLTSSIGTEVLNALQKMGLDKDIVKSAVQSATTSVKTSYEQNLIWSSSDWQSKIGRDDNHEKYNENAITEGLHFAYKTNGIVAVHSDESSAGSGNWHFVVNAGSVVKDIIDAVMKNMTDVSSQKDMNGNVNVDQTTSYNIQSKWRKVSTPTEETPKTADEIGKANVSFYKEMYNTMAVYGYLVDDKVNTSSYLNEKLQNNQYYVNGNPVENSKTVTKKVDENATKEAKEFYDMEMDKIKRKEKQLDIDLNKLQTEYSALTNDYNSVKGLIDANIQRSFTYCSQG